MSLEGDKRDDCTRIADEPVPVAARSKAWVCGGTLAGIAGSNPVRVMSVSCDCCVLSGRGLCVGPIIRPEESYRLCCVVVCDRQTSIMRTVWPGWGCWVMGRNCRRELVCCNVDCFSVSSVSLKEYLVARLTVCGCF